MMTVCSLNDLRELSQGAGELLWTAVSGILVGCGEAVASLLQVHPTFAHTKAIISMLFSNHCLP